MDSTEIAISMNHAFDIMHRNPADPRCRISGAQLARELASVPAQHVLNGLVGIAIPCDDASMKTARNCCGSEYLWIVCNLGYVARKLSSHLISNAADHAMVRKMIACLHVIRWAATSSPEIFENIWRIGNGAVRTECDEACRVFWLCYTRSWWMLRIAPRSANTDPETAWQLWLSEHDKVK